MCFDGTFISMWAAIPGALAAIVIAWKLAGLIERKLGGKWVGIIGLVLLIVCGILYFTVPVQYHSAGC